MRKVKFNKQYVKTATSGRARRGRCLESPAKLAQPREEFPEFRGFLDVVSEPVGELGLLLGTRVPRVEEDDGCPVALVTNGATDGLVDATEGHVLV